MREIKLTQGKIAIVDAELFDCLNGIKWHYDKGYAARNVWVNGKRRITYMHRIIMNTPVGLDTDHINGNKLDNRRINLRVCTSKENQRNKILPSNNSSGYKGVSWHKATGKWDARIKINGATIHLGLFVNKEEAAHTYNKAALKLFGQFARLNEVQCNEGGFCG